ncbi:sulfite exporter TauE/SafE family protein [Candidatus Electronema sp. JC]|uniref:HoxN/HupN/NixA family nickel/cobalt transporter n=1 Tax=Candidatus Electronema sp. JC TaxID=3401570 RepID=UPI003B432DA1
MTSLFALYSTAIFLGALHAFEPGHGKTLIAAYMVGTRGRAWDGVLLGAIVTVTHTFSVILLGLVAAMLSKKYSDQTLHNWLGLASAAMILIVGIWMLRQRLSGAGHGHFHLFGGHHHHPHDSHSHEHHHPHAHPHAHDHGHDHGHSHQQPHPADHSHEHLHPHVHPHAHEGYHEHPHPHDEPHSHHQPAAAAAKPTSKLELLLLGMSGGIIPCPAAIATLLIAIGAGKIAQGLTVTLFFSLGLGLVMISIGVLLSQSRHLTGKISENMDFARKMGIASAALIIIVGAYTMFISVRNILL